MKPKVTDFQMCVEPPTSTTEEAYISIVKDAFSLDDSDVVELSTVTHMREGPLGYQDRNSTEINGTIYHNSR